MGTQKLNQQPGEREPPKAFVTGWVRRSRDQDMFLCLSSAKKTEATLSAYKGKTLMQGIGYAIEEAVKATRWQGGTES